eukprot:6191118-Pleurochrysis_carterae.AAC.3
MHAICKSSGCCHSTHLFNLLEKVVLTLLAQTLSLDSRALREGSSLLALGREHRGRAETGKEVDVSFLIVYFDANAQEARALLLRDDATREWRLP